MCVVMFFFLHQPYLFHMGVGEGLGGKIGLMSVVFHVVCVVCGDVVIGDRDKGIIGMMAVGDCSEVWRGVCDMHNVCSSGVGVVFVWCPCIVGEGVCVREMAGGDSEVWSVEVVVGNVLVSVSVSV